MKVIQGVDPGCGCGELHRIDCLAYSLTQWNAMLGDGGGVFYPDGPEDAEWFALEHGARPLNPERWPW